MCVCVWVGVCAGAGVCVRVCVCVCVIMCICVCVCVHACHCLGSIARRKEDHNGGTGDNGGTGKLVTCFLGTLQLGLSDFFVVNHGMIKGEQSCLEH